MYHAMRLGVIAHSLEPLMKLPSDPIPPEVLLEAGHTAKAVSTVLRSPEFWSDFGDGLKIAGTGLFRSFSILQSMKEIRDDYKDPEISKGAKALSIFLKVGTIVLTGLAAVPLFGATVIAAPVLGVVVGAVSLLKNGSDYIKDWTKTRSINKDIKKLEAELNKVNMSFENNATLHLDLINSENEIQELTSRLDAINKSINIMGDKGSKNEEDLEDAITIRVSNLNTKIQKNSVLESSAKKINSHRQEIARLETKKTNASGEELDKINNRIELLTHKIKKNTDITKQIENAPDKIARFTKEKEALMDGLAQLSPGEKTKREAITSKIAHLDSKIQKHTVLCKRNEKILGYMEEQKKLNKELKNLSSKYKEYPKDVAEKLGSLNKAYLNERIQLLEIKINPVDPEKYRGDKLDKLKKQKENYMTAKSFRTDRVDKLHSALLNALESEKSELESKLKSKETVLKNKSNYVKLFFNNNTTLEQYNQASNDSLFTENVSPLVKKENELQNIKNKKPSDLHKSSLESTIKQDASKLLKLSAQVNNRKAELKAHKSKRNKRIKNILFSVAILGLAIATLAFPPAAGALLIATVSIGVVAVASAAYDAKKTRDATKKANAEKKEDTLQAMRSIDESMRKNKLTQSDKNTFSYEVKQIVQNEIKGLVQHFVPGQNTGNASQRVVSLLNDAAHNILQHKEITSLNETGQKQLTAYLSNPQTINKIYDLALKARVDHYFDKAQDPKFNLDSKEEGLAWIKYPRARRDVIESLFNKISEEKELFNPEQKNKILEQLRNQYIQAIREDLPHMSKTHAEQLITKLKDSPVLNSPNSSKDKSLDTSNLLGEFKTTSTKNNSIEIEPSSPAEDISKGLIERLQSTLKLADETFKTAQINPEAQPLENKLYSKGMHTDLHDKLKSISNPTERMQNISELVEPLSQSYRYEDFKTNGENGVLNAFNDRNTPTQKEAIEMLQSLYLEALEQAVFLLQDKSVNNKDLTDNQTHTLCEDARKEPLLQMSTEKGKPEDFIVKINKFSELHTPKTEPEPETKKTNLRSI